MSAAAIPLPDPMCPLPVWISEVVRETHDTYTLTTIAADGAQLPSFLPGQFSMVSEYAAGEVPISISGDAEIPGQLVYTIRSVGKVTEALARHKPGDYIGLRSSFGTAWPIDAARGRDVLLVAGGIGLAPLVPSSLILRGIEASMAGSFCCTARALRKISCSESNSAPGTRCRTPRCS